MSTFPPRIIAEILRGLGIEFNEPTAEALAAATYDLTPYAYRPPGQIGAIKMLE